jgi:hypothetical protein
MMRKTGVALAALAATIALAAITVVGAKGQGHATGSGGRAEFAMDAFKKTDGSNVRVGGYFRFIAFGGTTAVPRSNGIVVPEVAHLERNGRVCEFSGPGSMQVRVGSTYRTVRGICNVRVEDRRSPIAPSNTPDLIKVRFLVANSNDVFEWLGGVSQGDILVYERTLP